MNLADLRAKLLELYDEVIADYVLPNNSRFPAVYVGIVPESWRVTSGLEVNIRIMPSLDPTPLYHGELQLVEDYIIYLTHTEEADLYDATIAFLRLFPDARPYSQMITDPTVSRFQQRFDMTYVRRI